MSKGVDVRTLRNLLHRTPYAVARELFSSPPAIARSFGRYRVRWATGVVCYCETAEETIDHLLGTYAAQAGLPDTISRFHTLRAQAEAVL